jgi:hypothetical protein
MTVAGVFKMRGTAGRADLEGMLSPSLRAPARPFSGSLGTCLHAITIARSVVKQPACRSRVLSRKRGSKRRRSSLSAQPPQLVRLGLPVGLAGLAVMLVGRHA